MLAASALVYAVLHNPPPRESRIQIELGEIASDGSNGLFYIENTGDNPVTLENVTLYPGVSGCSWRVGETGDLPFVSSPAFNSSRVLEPKAMTALTFAPSCKGLVDGRAYILEVIAIDSSGTQAYAWCAGVLPPPGADTDWGCAALGSHWPY